MGEPHTRIVTPVPFPQSFWVHDGLLCAGSYPGDQDPAMRDQKLHGILDCGIRRVLSLMEPDERGYAGRPFVPYTLRLQELAAERAVRVACLRLPIPDRRAPQPSALRAILEQIDSGLKDQMPTYLHCWGGHGRTGTVVACHLIAAGLTPQAAIARFLNLRANLPKCHCPFEGNQERFVDSWPQSRISSEMLT